MNEKRFFTEEQINEKMNVIEIEDVVFTAEYVTGSEKNYVMHGSALLDGEVFPYFMVEIETEEIPEDDSAIGIVNSDWVEYDFIFDVK